MTQTPLADRPQSSTPDPASAAGASSGTGGARRRRAQEVDTSERGIISFQDRRYRSVRVWTRVIGAVLAIALVLGSIFPLLWMFKAGTSTAEDTLGRPFGLWTSGFHWSFFRDAFAEVNFGSYLLNTLWVCLGTVIVGMIVNITAGYFLGVLRPRYAFILEGLVMATLLIPAVVSLVALFSTVVDLPILHLNLINTFWAVWFPLGISSFNVLLMMRSFTSIPRSLIEAATIDGASNLRVLISVILPMSRPVIGVVSLLTLVAAYKEFLWPMLVLRDSGKQPLSVALPALEGTTPLPTYMAALFMALLVPVILFLIFHKQFLSSAGSQGAVKE